MVPATPRNNARGTDSALSNYSPVTAQGGASAVGKCCRHTVQSVPGPVGVNTAWNAVSRGLRAQAANASGNA